MAKRSVVLLVLLAAALAVIAQTSVVYFATSSKPDAGCTLDSVNDTCWVPMTGQAAFVRIASGGNLVATIKPVIALVPNPPSDGSSTQWIEDAAWFVGASAGPVSSISLVNPNDPVEHYIVTKVPALAIGIKVDSYTSGSLSGGTPPIVKVWSVGHQPASFALGDKGGTPILLPFGTISGGPDALQVMISHVLTAQMFNRKNCAVLHDGANDETVIAGDGAGLVRLYYPSGRTGNSVLEGRVGGIAWQGVPFVHDNGTRVQPGEAISTYPISGFITDAGYDEYKVRASTHTSGSATPCLSLSTGGGITKSIPLGRGFEWTEQQESTTTQTDATFRAAPGSGLSLYLQSVRIRCGSATAVNVTIEEGTSTLRHRYYCTAIGNGDNTRFDPPLKFAANTAATLTTSAAQTVFVAIGGFTAP